jgi:hypothetical protein
MPEAFLYRLRRRWWVLLVVLIVIFCIFVLTRGVSNSALITELANEATSKAATDARVIARLGEGLKISGQHSGEVSSDGVTVVVRWRARAGPADSMRPASCRMTTRLCRLSP